jgi:hypothetical protein
VAVVLAQLLIAAFAVWTIVRRRSAWRAWAFLAVAGTISLVVTASRIRNFGPSIGYDTRYMVELTWLFPLAVCGALAPSPARQPEPGPAADAGRARRPAIRILAPVAVALLVVAVLSARTARDEERAFGGEIARAYIDRLHAGVARLPPGTTVADRDVPAQTLPAWTNLGQLHNIMPFVDDRIPVDGPAPRGVAMVDDAGAVRVAEVQPALGGEAVALQRAGTLTTPGAAAVHRRAGALCVTAPPEAVTRITLRGARPVSAPQLYLLVDATATPAPVQVGATIDAGAGQGLVATTPTPLTLGATGGPSVLWLRTGTAAGAGVDVPAGATLCVRRLAVGPLVARAT